MAPVGEMHVLEVEEVRRAEANPREILGRAIHELLYTDGNVLSIKLPYRVTRPVRLPRTFDVHFKSVAELASQWISCITENTLHYPRFSGNWT
jgi:hypothetical protein